MSDRSPEAFGPDAVVEHLGLEPLAKEGGWFRRIHTGTNDERGRARSSTIYALFTREQFSALHRLDAVEQFFFLRGDPFEMFRIGVSGEAVSLTLGSRMEAGERGHLAFELGCWFGGRPRPGGAFGWSLLSCVVTPGFRWEGFELANREELLEQYPAFRDEILGLTR